MPVLTEGPHSSASAHIFLSPVSSATFFFVVFFVRIIYDAIEACLNLVWSERREDG